MRKNRRHLIILPALISLLFSGLLAGCSANQGHGADTHGLEMAPMESMPADVQKMPVTVQQAYQFAAANPDILDQIPCYCGCGDIGHTSNYACYVSSVDAQGKISFDPHAEGCSICVDITQDTMRLLKEKKSVQEIRAYIDNTYSKYGPSNMSPTPAPTSN